MTSQSAVHTDNLMSARVHSGQNATERQLRDSTLTPRSSTPSPIILRLLYTSAQVITLGGLRLAFGLFTRAALA